MIVMALDHVRVYFHLGAWLSDPTDLDHTSGILFFTRWITHYCAPVFVFLTGTAAFLYGEKQNDKHQLFKFLLSRGVWLIFLEVVVNNFIWTFDFAYTSPGLQVIWAIGFSMVCLSFLIYLPKRLLILIGFLLIAGHNLLDSVVVHGNSFESIIWYLLHQKGTVSIGGSTMIYFNYPVIPWIGVMTLGYCLGAFYQKGYSAKLRKKYLLILGAVASLLFVVIRGINVYGDLNPWLSQRDAFYTFLSFLKTTKYPPSLLYVLMTLGPALLFLSVSEQFKNRLTSALVVFGRVPLFYYFLHVLVIHLLAMLAIVITGGDVGDTILTTDLFASDKLATYGYSLWVAYAVWGLVIIMLYPLCKRYQRYKLENKEKWWLSYL